MATRVSTAGSLARGFRAKAAYFLAVVPVVGVGILLYKATHVIAKPEISIYRAADRGDFDAVQAHILTGTPVDDLSGDGHSALYYAVLGGNKDIVDLLLQNGARPDAEGVGQPTPLYAAAGAGKLDVMKALIAAGASPKDFKRSGANPLFAAASSGNTDVVTFLLDQGLDPNAKLRTGAGTVLCNACIKGNLETVRALLDHGASMTERGFDGRTPLHFAVQGGHLDVVEELINRGASADAWDQNSVLPLSTAFARKVDERLLWLLVDKTKKIQAFDYHSCTPLHYALDGGASLPLITALLKRGVDPNRINFHGDTALSIAINKKRRDVVDVLLANGARTSLRQLIGEELNTTERPRKSLRG